MLARAQSRRPRLRAPPVVADEQRAVVGFLEASETHGGGPVERIDTHISHLFLSGDRAYKLKRALKTNFLDFSTVEKRAAACQREIEVNAGVASALYLRALPIIQDGEMFGLGGTGEPVDWVVVMKRFDRAQEFDVLAEAGVLDLDHIEALADVVAEMHLNAPRTPEFGGGRRVRATITQIAEAIAELPMADELQMARADWRARAEAALADRTRQLDARRRHGFVRRCHGDLHLGNICMFEGRPTPFDALEFNEEMASTDVLYDVAFTAMDLIERDLKPLANAFLNRYLSATRDYSGLALLPLFVSMRAAVRSLVTAYRPVADPAEPTAAERLDFAIGCLTERAAPRLIAIGGLSGSGKSTVARRIAPDLGGGAGSVLLRSDVTRKRLVGAAPETKLPRDAYRPEVSRRVYTCLLRDAARALSAGSATILDATFLSVPERQHAETLAGRAGVRFTGIWLECAPDDLRRRIASRGRDASDADIAVLEAQLERNPGTRDWIPVRSEAGPEETARSVLEILRDRHGAG